MESGSTSENIAPGFIPPIPLDPKRNRLRFPTEDLVASYNKADMDRSRTKRPSDIRKGPALVYYREIQTRNPLNPADLATIAFNTNLLFESGICDWPAFKSAIQGQNINPNLVPIDWDLIQTWLAEEFLLESDWRIANKSRPNAMFGASRGLTPRDGTSTVKIQEDVSLNVQPKESPKVVGLFHHQIEGYSFSKFSKTLLLTEKVDPEGKSVDKPKFYQRFTASGHLRCPVPNCQYTTADPGWRTSTLPDQLLFVSKMTSRTSSVPKSPGFCQACYMAWEACSKSKNQVDRFLGAVKNRRKGVSKTATFEQMIFDQVVVIIDQFLTENDGPQSFVLVSTGFRTSSASAIISNEAKLNSNLMLGIIQDLRGTRELNGQRTLDGGNCLPGTTIIQVPSVARAKPYHANGTGMKCGGFGKFVDRVLLAQCVNGHYRNNQNVYILVADVYSNEFNTVSGNLMCMLEEIATYGTAIRFAPPAAPRQKAFEPNQVFHIVLSSCECGVDNKPVTHPTKPYPDGVVVERNHIPLPKIYTTTLAEYNTFIALSHDEQDNLLDFCSQQHPLFEVVQQIKEKNACMDQRLGHQNDPD
ncbi:hypothetical protein BDR26DRAFT_935723 [Obelidium mucronatum]|nr:hypothetical protein BDR26DRAFT_935723 [Obelidium mucronatum]